jgi:uncharacterized protein (TIGR00725 family)
VSTRRKIVAVIGDGAASLELGEIGEAVGRGLVDAGFRIVTGGLGGVMEAASKGARSAASYREGDVVGILPSADARSANAFVDIVLPSGLGIARNTLVVQMADAVIAIGGGSGTLSEIALGWQLGKPVVALAVEGWSGRLAGERVDARRSDTVLAARDASEAVSLVERALGVQLHTS